ncbi:Alpha/Beta hydrolase protein [Massariosphaeria phaeospora]|uniref:Alpha/Beta hydrolase protein n=1 Tax=Massariosphaeria phaeospora TaxID=100035 RepID=A0A7C8HYV7_9PLEO|nr:Alpha/Beta hydrolase protein [Massariosphaeria phaeospora]
MDSIKPFTIAVPDARLQRLKQKLALSDFPNEPTDVQPWSLGTPLADLKRLAAYWENQFDWRAAEAKLNQFPQFTASIAVDGFDTYDVHCIHQKSKVENAIPLLFIHGWPGSFIEVTRMLPELVQGAGDAPAFHVVAPSLIDFGFSSASGKSGFGIDQHAEAYHKLMLALGYTEYVVQGGDLGSLIARSLALHYGPSHVKAHHLSNAAPAEPTAATHPALHAECQSTPLTASDLAGLARTAHFNTEGNGYYRKQATKPQTVASFMADSPTGLLAWLYECLHDWTDAYTWTDDELLTWICIYYFSTAGPGASTYIYYVMEHAQPHAFAASQTYSPVPLGVSRFAKDLLLLPRRWNATLGPVVFEREYERGGHFAGWERPDALVGDLRVMFGKGGGAYGVVEGKSGY